MMLVIERYLLSVFMFCMLFTLSFTEPQFNTRYGARAFQIRNLSFLFRGNNSNPVVSAREYLGKFGWVEPTDWTSISPRVNETVEEEESVLFNEMEQANQPQNNSAVVAWLDEGNQLTDEEFSKALTSFQRANKLKVTGILDDQTILIMTQLRCGVPDQTKKPNRTTDFVQNSTDVEENSSALREDVVTFSGDGAASTGSTPSPTQSTLAGLARKRRSGQVLAYNHFQESFSKSIPLSRKAESDSLVARLNQIATDLVSEGELPEESRVESMEGVLAALRKEKMEGKSERIFDDSHSVSPNANIPNLLARLLTTVQDSQMKNRRKKRSLLYKHFNSRNGWGLAFAKDVITWRLVQEWPSTNNPFMSANEVWFTLKLAFRMWSEILPRTFREDNSSPVSEVDILIGFGTGLHNRCPVQFLDGPFMREYAHAWPLPKAEVHFNDMQPFVPVSWIATTGGSPETGPSSNYPISLLKVAIHEIGHTLGLPHNEQRLSIMNPFYRAEHSKQLVELSTPDRQNIKDIYGTCELSFDVVFDWVRQDRLPNGNTYWKYNTYFFRKTWYWLYENRAQRPRYGDPKLTAEYWRGVMQYPNDPHMKLDGAVHIRSWRSPNGPTFFFKGDVYVEYDSIKDQTRRFDRNGRTYPRRIEDDFVGVPFPINTVYYNFQEELLYFFKDNMVYRYSWPRRRLLDSGSISQSFRGWGGASPLPNSIDAAYYSYAYRATYFFKGKYFWKLADKRDRIRNIGISIPYNSVGPRQRISSKWKYICDVDESELIMNVPTS